VKHYPGLRDRLLCLLPFEPAFFARHGLPATFVGHPVLESGCDTGDAARFRARHGLAPDDRVLIVMPGSRRTEISRLLPILRATLDRLGEAVVPVVPLAGAVAAAVTEATAGWTSRPVLVATQQDKHDAFAAASAALTKSGTSTLELALAGVPMVVTYRANPITIWITRRLALVKYASLLNLLSDREIVPELLQEDATPDKLAAALRTILTPEGAAAQRAAFAAPLAMLRAPNVAPPVGTLADGASGDGTLADGSPADGSPGDGTPLSGTPLNGTPSDAAAAAVLDLIEQSASHHPVA
jgi:lipid-A-disaccharide synthase